MSNEEFALEMLRLYKPELAKHMAERLRVYKTSDFAPEPLTQEDHDRLFIEHFTKRKGSTEA